MVRLRSFLVISYTKSHYLAPRSWPLIYCLCETAWDGKTELRVNYHVNNCTSCELSTSWLYPIPHICQFCLQEVHLMVYSHGSSNEQHCCIFSHLLKSIINWLLCDLNLCFSRTGVFYWRLIMNIEFSFCWPCQLVHSNWFSINNIMLFFWIYFISLRSSDHSTY